MSPTESKRSVTIFHNLPESVVQSVRTGGTTPRPRSLTDRQTRNEGLVRTEGQRSISPTRVRDAIFRDREDYGELVFGVEFLVWIDTSGLGAGFSLLILSR